MKGNRLAAPFPRQRTVLVDSDNVPQTTPPARKRCLVNIFRGGIVAVIFAAASATQAALVTYEGFNYLPLSIDGENGYSNYWTTSWGQFLGDQPAYGVTNVALSDPSELLYTTSNSVFTLGGFTGRFFAQPFNWALAGTTNYFSILIRPNNTPATNHYYGLQIFSNNANTGYGVDLFVGKNGDGLNWGLQAGVGTDAFSHVAATLNQTVFLVVRVVFYEGAPDVFSLYVNPTPGNPEPATPDAVITNDIGTQDGIALNTGNGGAASFGQIRIGATFASVTPTTSALDPNLIAYEPFDYTQASENVTLLDNQGGGYGWDNVNWDQFLGSGGTNFSVIDNSLSDPSGKLATVGNSIQAVTPQTTYQAFAGRYNLYTALTGSTNANPTYYSFLVRPDNLGPSNGAAFFEFFGQPSGNDLYAGYLFGSPYWGLQNQTNQVLSTVPVVSNQTAFLVVRANYAPAGSPFTVQLYVNPTPGAPEPATPDVTYTYTQSGQQNGVALQVQNGAAATFDELRIGTNYADVTPAVSVVANLFNITSIAVTNTSPYPSIVLTWNTTAGTTNVVQATNGSNGNFSTNGFADISAQMIIGGSGNVTTNFMDSSGATNRPARYYRVRQVP
ncbi:MAG TPA: hypothetical protein VL171_08250 [Verrucomicrobiae bacterium]|nr:hypothetical protein [Verrucomicrobiae bacterium]